MSKRKQKGKTDETSPHKTRGVILEATVQVLVREGYEGVTTRRIAEAAGVNIGTLHYHFGSKEALLSEAVLTNLRRFQQTLREEVEKESNIRASLEMGIQVCWKAAREENVSLIRYDFILKTMRQNAGKEVIQSVYQGYTELIAEQVQKYVAEGGKLSNDLSPEGIAQAVVALVDGIILRYLATRDEAAVREGLQALRQLMDIALL